MKKHIWLFGTYGWQGNPKALFMYMQKYKKNTHETWWIADNKEQADIVSDLGYPVAVVSSKLAESLFMRTEAYITENFRESYPESLNIQANIINLWHGVGLKHIEYALGADSALAESIARKYIRNFELYKNQLKFLVTSQSMASHFAEDMPLDDNQLIRGGYPRNEVYRDSELATFDHENIGGFHLSEYDRVILFAPTYRFKNVNGSFRKLLPSLDQLTEVMGNTNSLFIVKLHPFMLKDPDYKRTVKEYSHSKHIMFWDSANDIYEIFNQINVAIVDYSSIFYDLLEAGVEKFVRYIPDYNDYVNDSELIGDYYELTDGIVASSYTELLTVLTEEISVVSKKQALLDYFFEYEANQGVDDLIQKIDATQVQEIQLKELHTFDIFDTLIRRNTVAPESIFEQIRELLKSQSFVSELDDYLVDNYPAIRHQVEFDIRDVFRKTTFERDTDQIEVTLSEILRRLQNNYNFSEITYDFLYNTEIQLEIDAVEPIQKRIDYLLSLRTAGHEVYLVSDMYLPEETVRQMVIAADKRLEEIPLYLSSNFGYQKSTGKLFTYIFFDRKYQFKSWTHYGDNKRADGSVPRRLGIQTINHDMDAYTKFETQIYKDASNSLNYDSYRVATMLQRYRWQQVSSQEMSFNRSRYYAYAYVGTAFVPYVNWAIKDALKRGYQTLYFISRDGYYLKQIADVLIEEKGYSINTKYIYGSRKAWRVASFITEVDAETFSPFGLFTNMGSFDEMVTASQLPESELLHLIPELEGYRNEPTLKGDIAIGIRELFEKSTEYRERLVDIAAMRRPIVKKYLQQVINFDEKFAFVEFWGRGYTQDTFTRLLHDAAGAEIDDPYYYARNFTPDHGKSIRHRFTTKNANFSYFEPIFATTPYKSIEGYIETDEGIMPVIESSNNEFHEFITMGIQDYARDYARLDLSSEDALDRQISETSYTYQFAKPQDENIASVFSNFKDNVSSYGEPIDFAPILSMAQVKKARTDNELRQWTRNIRMSLARSTTQVRDFWNIKRRLNIPSMTREFPINALKDYISIPYLPIKALILRNQSVFQSVDWTEESKQKQTLKLFDVVDVLGIEWTKSLVPRLRLKDGYITASKEWVTIFDDSQTVFAGTKLMILQKTTLFTLDINGDFIPDGLVNPNKILTVLSDENVAMIRTNIGWIANNINAYTILSDEMFANVALFNQYVISSKEIEHFRFYPHVNSLIAMPVIEAGILLKLKKFVEIGTNVYMELQDGTLISSETKGLNKLNVKPRTDFSNYHIAMKDDNRFVALKSVSVYDSIDIEQAAKVRVINPLDMFEVQEVVWSDGGTPRLHLVDGYVTANRKNVGQFIEYQGILTEQKENMLRVAELLNNLVISFETGDIFIPTKFSIVDGDIQLTNDIQRVAIGNANKVRKNYQEFLYEHNFQKVRVLKKIACYTAIDFNTENKTTDIFAVGSLINVQGIEWTKGGTPRLKIDGGYISANRENVSVVK